MVIFLVIFRSKRMIISNKTFIHIWICITTFINRKIKPVYSESMTNPKDIHSAFGLNEKAAVFSV